MGTPRLGVWWNGCFWANTWPLTSPERGAHTLVTRLKYRQHGDMRPHRFCPAALGFLFLLGFSMGATSLAADSGFPVPVPELHTKRWSARWITHPTAPKSDYGVYLFRRALELPEKPGRFVVHVTGDARYQLWVNGLPVCRGPQASDPAELRYESVDLAPWLVAGSNVIAAQLRGYGDLAP